MTDANADKITVLADALRRIGQARIHRAEHGRYPDDVAEDQEFDDWAADVAAEALEKAGCPEIGSPPVAVVPRVICVVEGGNVQGARANVPVSFDVLDRDNQAAANEEKDKTPGAADEAQRYADLEAEYETLPEAVY